MFNERPYLTRLPEAIADRVRISGPAVVAEELSASLLLNKSSPFSSDFSIDFGPIDGSSAAISRWISLLQS